MLVASRGLQSQIRDPARRPNQASCADSQLVRPGVGAWAGRPWWLRSLPRSSLSAAVRRPSRGWQATRDTGSVRAGGRRTG
jgi:hypothetical protein